MKLLFDQNLSPKLANRLADLFPGSMHVQSVALDCADDNQVWEHARLNGFVIVTKDEDYNNLNVVRGTPPKVIWLQLRDSVVQKPGTMPRRGRNKQAQGRAKAAAAFAPP